MRGSQMMAVALVAAVVLAGCDDDTRTVADLEAASVPDHPGMNAVASGDPSVPGGFTVVPLARGPFPDDIDVTFRIKLNRATNVVHVRDPSDALFAQITFQPGGSVGWHTHHGPAIVTVASGALSIINATDCVHRVYGAGRSFVDPGQGNVHVGFNDTAGETVVYVTFLDVPAGQGPTIPADDPGCAT
ncbi:MAG: cupin domain-containing protein [Longimicrobiales bacterium]